MPPFQQSNAQDPLLQRSSQVLYRCFEEVGSTKGALYILDEAEKGFRLIAHYGWPRHFMPPAFLGPEEPLLIWVQREKGPFIINDSDRYTELRPFREASLNTRFLLAPIYDRGKRIGLLLQRDRHQGAPYSEERDIPLTLSVCQELAEIFGEAPTDHGERNVQKPQTPIPVTAPPSEAMVSPVAPTPVLHQDTLHRVLAGTFLPEQRAFFWEVAESLFQVLPLSAVALWMEEPSETRPILAFSRRPLSPALKREIQAAVSQQAPDLTPTSFRILPRVGSSSLELLDGTFKTCLPVLLEEEGGSRDLLFLLRLQDQPFTETELAFVRHIGRLLGCHIQESRIHERYHRAFLSVSQQLLGSAAEGLRSHSLNTAQLARTLATRLGLPSVSVEAISISAILHDVGSLLLPQGLRTRAELTPVERDHFRAHPVLAATFLKDFKFPFDVPTIIRYHHEWWDGSGYPEGLIGEEIPIGSRVIGLIEAFEVMTADSGYRPPISKAEALQEIRQGAGTQFDPVLVQEFLTMMDPGSR